MKCSKNGKHDMVNHPKHYTQGKTVEKIRRNIPTVIQYGGRRYVYDPKT